MEPFFQGCPLNILRLRMKYILDFLWNHFLVTIHVVFRGGHYVECKFQNLQLKM